MDVVSIVIGIITTAIGIYFIYRGFKSIPKKPKICPELIGAIIVAALILTIGALTLDTMDLAFLTFIVAAIFYISGKAQ